MKAIVAEINKTHMILITDRGDFVKQRLRPGCDIGDEIELSPQKSMVGLYRRISAAAASILILAVLFSGVYAYCTPTVYVSVDINPSLTLSLNRFDRVIAVQGLNEDADKLLSTVGGLRNHRLDQAVEDIIHSASQKGYLSSSSENSIMFVVSTRNSGSEDSIMNRLDTVSQQELSKLNDKYNVILEKTDVEAYKNAVANHISPGKLILADKIKAVKPDFNAEEIKELSVEQALGMIKEDHNDKENKDDKGNNTGKSGKEDKNTPSAPAVADDKGKKDDGKAASATDKDSSKDKADKDTTEKKDDKDQQKTADNEQKEDKDKDKEQKTAENDKGKDSTVTNNPKVDDKTTKPAGNEDGSEKDNKDGSSAAQSEDKGSDKEQDKDKDKGQDKGDSSEKGGSESKGNGKGK